MSKFRVYAIMVEKETGGFSTGIGTETKTYTKDEIDERKYFELTKNTPLMVGCCWSYSIERIK